ncbi:hypothetical protein J2Z60_000153 [Lactobacillus colini]|uniref:Uncharacterized protein n=1 Tax=Lactobacillus colini TaxID=1819254 RepID=A0ABS4MBD6_9LACO|nr:hypothetical protein [Lactobacillus colini]MBP2056991.1 hypothetical protein [Lactobacillus colini]
MQKRKVSKKERLKIDGFYKNKAIKEARILALNVAHANGYKYGRDESSWMPFISSHIKPSEALEGIKIMARDSFSTIMNSGICDTDIRIKSLFWDMYHVFKKGKYQRMVVIREKRNH